MTSSTGTEIDKALLEQYTAVGQGRLDILMIIDYEKRKDLFFWNGEELKVIFVTIEHRNS